MIAAFQIILLIIIIMSWVVACGDRNQKRQENMVFISAIGMSLFFASAFWL